MDPGLVRELQELEQRDGELAGHAKRLRLLEDEVAAVRARAEEIHAFFAAYPDTETRVRAAVAEAEEEVARRRREIADAQGELEHARNDDARARAQRVLTRAEDHLVVADAGAARAVEERDALERDAASLPGELPALAERAAAVSADLTGVAAPDATPGELAEWAGRAHAALFAAAAQIDGQRDRIIREANEIATMVLGEPTFGSTPAQARARVEAALR